VKTLNNSNNWVSSLLLAPLLSVFFISPSCDKKNDNAVSSNEAQADLHSTRRPDIDPSKARNIYSKIKRSDYAVSAEDVEVMRGDFKDYLARYIDVRIALEHWLQDGCMGLTPTDRDRVAATLLYSISEMAYQEGGEYILKNFGSRDSRVRALTNWFSEGVRKHESSVFYLLSQVGDIDEKEKLAERLGARIAALRDQDYSLDWMIGKIDVRLQQKSLVGFLGVGDVELSQDQVFKLANNESISLEARSEIIKYYTKKIVGTDPLQAINFLKANAINDPESWRNLILGVPQLEPTQLEDLLKSLPSGMTAERAQLLGNVSLKYGISSIEPYLNKPEFSDQVAPIVAAAFVTTGSFDDNLRILRKISDPQIKKNLLVSCIKEAIVADMPERSVIALKAELNDNAAYEDAVRKASAYLDAVKRSKSNIR
jgi:hypothetical protein